MSSTTRSEPDTMLRRGRPTIPLVRQSTSSGCGAAALAMVLHSHGRSVGLADLEAALALGPSGTNAAALLRVAGSYGLQGRAVALDAADVGVLPPGSILHWR